MLKASDGEIPSDLCSSSGLAVTGPSTYVGGLKKG